MTWLDFEVMDGPAQIIGKVARLLLIRDTHSRIDNNYCDERVIGRIDFFKMFGDFGGMEKISRKHLLIQHARTEGQPHQLLVSDVGSSNGTTFPAAERGLVLSNDNCTVVLGGIIELNISMCTNNFTILADEYIIPAPRMNKAETNRQKVMNDDEVKNHLTSEAVKLCTKLDMGWHVRRSWSHREEPVINTPLSGFEWKLVPKDEYKEKDSFNGEIKDDFWEGHYYLLSCVNGDLQLEHSGVFAGVLGPHMSCHHYVIQEGWNSVNHGGHYGGGFSVSEWLEKQVSKYPPNFYCVT